MNGVLETPQPTPPSSSHTGVIVVVIVVVVVIAAALLWYFMSSDSGVAPAGGTADTELEGENLGSTLYEGTRNPVSGGIPESTAGVPNPIEGIYTNPFE